MKALVDYRIKDKYIDYLEKNQIECIKVFCNDVYDEVSGHPDIFFTVINNELFKARNVKTSKKITAVDGESVKNGYPDTAKYNICINSKYIIGNFKYIEKNIKKIINKSNLKMINVNQGYARCSLFSIDENNYITSDIGIKKCLENEGFSVAFVDSSSIKLLDKYGNYSKINGFIGGCLAKINNDIILFGDKDKIKDGQVIEKKVKELGYNFIDFENEDVIDYGSIIIID